MDTTNQTLHELMEVYRFRVNQEEAEAQSAQSEADRKTDDVNTLEEELRRQEREIKRIKIERVELQEKLDRRGRVIDSLKIELQHARADLTDLRSKHEACGGRNSDESDSQSEKGTEK